MLKFLIQFLPDGLVGKYYQKWGLSFGAAAYYRPVGKVTDFDKRLNYWGLWEAEYARRGYRTIDINRFIASAIHGKKLPELFKRRGGRQRPEYHFETMKAHFGLAV